MTHALARSVGPWLTFVLAVRVALSSTAAEEARPLRIVKQPGLAWLERKTVLRWGMSAAH